MVHFHAIFNEAFLTNASFVFFVLVCLYGGTFSREGITHSAPNLAYASWPDCKADLQETVFRINGHLLYDAVTEYRVDTC